MEAVLRYLDKVDPAGASRARRRYSCLDMFGGEMQQYGTRRSRDDPSCEREVVTQLLELHGQRAEYASRDGRVREIIISPNRSPPRQERRGVLQNDARGRAESWIWRSAYRRYTRGACAFLERSQPSARIVVSGANSHLGDARATQMRRGRCS